MQPEMSAMADLYSQSVTALDDLNTLRKSVSLLRRISLRLFEKLRGSAAFLQVRILWFLYQNGALEAHNIVDLNDCCFDACFSWGKRYH